MTRYTLSSYGQSMIWGGKGKLADRLLSGLCVLYLVEFADVSVSESLVDFKLAVE